MSGTREGLLLLLYLDRMTSARGFITYPEGPLWKCENDETYASSDESYCNCDDTLILHAEEFCYCDEISQKAIDEYDSSNESYCACAEKTSEVATKDFTQESGVKPELSFMKIGDESLCTEEEEEGVDYNDLKESDQYDNTCTEDLSEIDCNDLIQSDNYDPHFTKDRVEIDCNDLERSKDCDQIHDGADPKRCIPEDRGDMSDCSEGTKIPYSVRELRKRFSQLGDEHESSPSTAVTGVTALNEVDTTSQYSSSSTSKTLGKSWRKDKPFKMEAPSAINRRKLQMEIDRQNVIISRKLKDVKPVVVLPK